MEQHQFGLREWAGLCERKDATIAALQARVQELEDGTSALLNQQSERLAAENEKLMMALSQLTQRTAECDALKLVNDTHMKTVMKLSHVVEKRTAELEALRPLYDDMWKQFAESQAELERVMSLIKALPKVEGEIAVKCTEVDLSDVWGITLNGYFTFQSALFDSKEEADAYVAILQHRQGMEG